MPKKLKIKINNIVLTANLPMERRFTADEIKRLINFGKLGWQLICEEYCPRLQAIIKRDEYKKNGKQKCASITLWQPNTINIAGVTTREEGKEYIQRAINDIKKTIKGIINDG